MTPPATLFHALLRPSVLQILRSSGYHCARPAVLDSLTDLAAQYLLALCRAAAAHAADNSDAAVADGEVRPAIPALVDVRMALEDCGALGLGEHDDDDRAAREFVDWFAGLRNAEIRRIAVEAEEETATDWLSALKQKHSKTGEDAKFQGTLLGKGNEHGEVLVEGGNFDTIKSWAEHMRDNNVLTPPPSIRDQSERPPSSGLSSLRDGDIDEDMDFGGGGNGESAMDIDAKAGAS